MEAESSRPGSPATPGGPLQPVTPDRVNQRTPGGRESSVHDKISQFNSLSLSMQSKQLERKTADAALKRAMLGREEAESEMRRLKEEARMLRKAIDEGKERERRVGERLETVMENYGRAKETHAHTQALWEKEIRRARKESFKAQSAIVKLQEDLKFTRNAMKMVEENLQHEKERSRAREQEAFTARHQIVGVQEQLVGSQEQLEQALARIKLVEQERDAYKEAAESEEVARLAAQGRIPLPCEDPDDEFASPPKRKRSSTKIRCRDPRVSLTTMEIVSSAASEQEIEELTAQVQWERQRADRAQEMIEFMQAECQMHCCPSFKSKRRTSMLAMQQIPRATSEVVMPSIEATPEEEEENLSLLHNHSPELKPKWKPPKPKKGPRLSTIFCPKEGIFRTVSEQEAVALEFQRKAEIVITAHEKAEAEPLTAEEEAEMNLRMYARTPSVDPPSFAILAQERTSLLSLIDAPLGDAKTDDDALPTTYSIPTVPDTEPGQMRAVQDEAESSSQPRESLESRPSTSATYTVTTTTTVPVRDSRSSSIFSQKLRTPSNCSSASFDLSDPAMTPTMTREEALAKIRERRGRARSVAQSATTPHVKAVQGMDRRETSAPIVRAGSKSRRDTSAPIVRAVSKSRRP